MPAPEAPTRTELEAAAFRALVEHLRQRSDVQNIDLMNLAGFCRNCLARWYRDAAAERGQEMSDDAARELIYGMPYQDWRARFQTESSPEAKADFARSHN
jgi:hypothetical protein